MTAQTVADKSDAVLQMEPDWLLARALLGGTRTMRAAGQTYLPKWPKEVNEAYTLRLGAAVLFPAYQRTVYTLASKPFSKPIVLNEDVPERFKPWLRDIDLQGRDINAFAPDVLEKALGYGLAGILIEYPRAEGVRTLADEQAAGLRPYWVEINATQILGWRAERVAGVWRLTQLRFWELVEVPDGEYATKSVEQVRVLTPGAWTTHQLLEGSGWTMIDEGKTTLNEIPFVPVYGGRDGFMLARPPLLEVAHLNVAHWQSASDQQTILHVARVPILTVTGVEDEKFVLEVGASAAMRLPEGAVMAYVEHSGAAIGAGVTELDKIEERMRQAGAELLVLTPRMTATQVMTENVVGLSLLQRITLTYQDALNQALAITARWVGEPQGGTVTLFNDYGVATLQEASAQLLLATNQAGKISDETLHAEFQRRGILEAGMSWQDEQARLDLQGPALDTMGTSTPPLALQAPVGQPGAPVTPTPAVPTAPVFDMDALIAAIGAITFPAPIVNVEAQPAPQITVESPNITVNVPEQPAAQITVEAPNITVEAPNITLPPIEINMPEQPAPTINVTPAPVTVNSPPINVTIQKGGEVKFTEDADGNIVGAKLQ